MRTLLVSWLLMVCIANAMAATPATVVLDELTWTELRDRIRTGSTTIIVPIGGTEQNGPHMVLGKHNVRVKAIAEKIAVALGNTLVAPVISYTPEGQIDPPAAHMRFSGTISVAEETFRKTLESAARSFRQHGMRDIVFIGDHGGYQKDMKAVADRLNREWSEGRKRAPTDAHARVHAIEEYYLAAGSGFAQLLKDKGYRDDEIGTHAGLADTSLALAVEPGLVRTGRLALPAGTADGVHGDPRRASAELGRLGIDLIVNRTVDAIRKATRR